MKGSLLIILVTICCLNSCVTHKKMLILNENSSSVSDTLQERVYSEYLLQEGDILDIKVSSLDNESVAVFNKGVGAAVRTNETESSLYINGYIIDVFGDIRVPYIGVVHVKGQTLSSLNSLLSKKLELYFKHSVVAIKLVNIRFSVLGEVKTPGVHYVYNNNTNVLQALAKAGGVDVYGNRTKVKIIRRAFNGNTSTVIDLSKEDVIFNEFFYLMPDDVIYVEPYKSKAVSVNVPLAALMISTISLVIVLINSFKTK
jgi:polysaccharide biosynthesis/export protein